MGQPSGGRLGREEGKRQGGGESMKVSVIETRSERETRVSLTIGRARGSD